MPGTLTDAVAIVTGASRGVGKGVALELGHAGATVYVTGRSRNPGEGPLVSMKRSRAPSLRRPPK